MMILKMCGDVDDDDDADDETFVKVMMITVAAGITIACSAVEKLRRKMDSFLGKILKCLLRISHACPIQSRPQRRSGVLHSSVERNLENQVLQIHDIQPVL
jgi:hypothetical protein